MKILMLADHEEQALWGNWNEHTRQAMSGVKLILSAGDLDAEYLEFLVTVLNAPLVYVRGNHDGRYDRRPPGGCVNADGRIVKAAGLRILGLGGSMRYKPGSPDMYTEREMQLRINSLRWRLLADKMAGREGFDILLTHAPCKGWGDQEDLAHTGFDCFNDLLHRFRPQIHCFGHVHREYGHFKRRMEHPSGAVLINASGYYVYHGL